jgi:DNA polymerase-3 subunit epsilon
VADAFLGFLGDSRLVIHNADFDLKFLNAELEQAQRPPLEAGRAVDTVALARRRFPGASASLDALCRRFGIDLSVREKHGALVDCELLAKVYLELLGGRQPGLALAGQPKATLLSPAARPVRPPRSHAASPAEKAAHQAFLDKLKDPLWRR